MANFLPEAELLQSSPITAEQMFPNNSRSSEQNRSLYVNGRGWHYAADEKEVLLIVLEARTNQAATAFAESQSTRSLDGTLDAFIVDRSSSQSLSVGLAGARGRMVVYVEVRDPDTGAQSRHESDALARELYLAQRAQTPDLPDLETDAADAIGRQFGYTWGMLSALIVGVGMVVGSVTSLVTDRGTKEWWHNRNGSGMNADHIIDLTDTVAPIHASGHKATILRILIVSTTFGAVLAWPGLQPLASFTIAAIVLWGWWSFDAWRRSRVAMSEVARGKFAVIISGLGGFLSSMVLLLGVALMAAGVAGVLIGHADAPPIVLAGMLLLGLQIVNMNRGPVRLCKRLLQRKVREQVNEDARQPILLLRSFQDDALQVRPPTVLTGAIDTFAGEIWVRFEEVIAWVAWMFGPLRTFGQPGTVLEPLGAARDYHDDSTWQTAIRDLSDRARAYVLIVGRSPSLVWEIFELRSQLRLSQAVFVFPPLDEVESGRRIAVVSTALDLDPRILSLSTGRKVLAMGFSAAGEPRVYVAAGRTSDAYVTALSVALSNADIGAVARPISWASAVDNADIVDLAHFEPGKHKSRKSIISRVSDLATNFVGI